MVFSIYSKLLFLQQEKRDQAWKKMYLMQNGSDEIGLTIDVDVVVKSLCPKRQ